MVGLASASDQPSYGGENVPTTTILLSLALALIVSLTSTFPRGFTYDPPRTRALNIAVGGPDASEIGDATRGADDFVELAAKACSFAGATTVLMANGTRKPIEDVEVGDKVIATDPESGEQVAKAVEHVFVHDDDVIDLVAARSLPGRSR